MNEYEEYMLKKEKENDVSKALGCLTIVVVLVVVFAYNGIKSFFIVPSVVEDIAKDCFSSGDPYPPINGAMHYDSGWVVISANANNEEDGIEKLRKSYNKISKKLSTKKVSKVTIAVYEYSGEDWGLTKPYRLGRLLFSPNMTIKDIKAIDWKGIKTYEEFKQIVNIE